MCWSVKRIMKKKREKKRSNAIEQTLNDREADNVNTTRLTLLSILFVFLFQLLFQTKGVSWNVSTLSQTPKGRTVSGRVRWPTCNILKLRCFSLWSVSLFVSLKAFLFLWLYQSNLISNQLKLFIFDLIHNLYSQQPIKISKTQVE